ncbi:MAG: peptidylprolyl isomerase [Bacteroidota bacterium]
MKHRLLTYFSGALIFASCSVLDEDSVAVVNGRAIPAAEFRSRLEAYIQATGVRDNILLRQTVVMNMIHESLILEDAERLGWETDPEGQRRMDEIRAQALLDTYAKVLMEEVRISEDDLYKEFRKRNTRVSARYVYAQTEEHARSLKRRLEEGETFERIAREIFDDPGLAGNGGYVGYFGPGDMDEEFESAAFNLPVGSLSDPVRISAGYAVLRVEDKTTLPLQSEHDYARVRHELEAAVREKQSRKILERRAEELSGWGNPVIDETLLNEVFEFWKTTKPINPESSVSILPYHEAVVTFGYGTWTSREILARLLSMSEKQRKRIKTQGDFTRAVRGLVAREKLVDLAKQAGLENHVSVTRQIHNVRMNYLLKRWMKEIEERVTRERLRDDELRAHFEKNGDSYVMPPEIRVKEVLVRDRATAEAVISEIRRGMDFSAAAKRSSIRRWSADRGGDLGFGTRSTFGAMGEKLFKAKIGRLIGPERVDPYYGIFMVTEKREGRKKSFNETREQLASELQSQKKKQAVERALEELRQRAAYSINDDVMKNMVIGRRNSPKESVQ